MPVVVMSAQLYWSAPRRPTSSVYVLSPSVSVTENGNSQRKALPAPEPRTVLARIVPAAFLMTTGVPALISL